jgi:hypothetical protein
MLGECTHNRRLTPRVKRAVKRRLHPLVGLYLGPRFLSRSAHCPTITPIRKSLSFTRVSKTC